jgi:tRNA A37 threonylcarbamoyladenosine synthetase subunit TsaC/SUA5/YrdC
MPDHRIALELLSETGPLAVSSANKHGEPAATTAAAADAALGDSVAVVLDAGESGSVASTIVDATGLVQSAQPGEGTGKLRIVRDGVISRDAIIAVVGAESCE